MRDSLRRFLLFFSTVMIGTIFIFIDLPVFYILLITILLGIIFLFLTGPLSLSNLRKRKDLSDKLDMKEPEVPKKPTFREKFAGKAPSFYNGYLRIERLFAPLGRTAKGIKGRFARSKKEDVLSAPSPERGDVSGTSKSEKKRLFGGLRDRLSRKKQGDAESNEGSKGPDQRSKLSPHDEATGVAGALAASEKTKGSGGNEEDLFGDISLDDMDEEIFGELGEEDPASGLKPGTPNQDPDADEGFDIGSGEMMDDVASILANNEALLGEEFEGDELSPDMDLDSIDLDALDLDEDLEDLDDLSEDLKPQTINAAPVEYEEEEDQEEEEVPVNVISANQGYQFNPDKEKSDPNLGSFGGSDSDLLSSLKGDVKAIKKDLDLSLVRDLKDVDVTAEEVEEELSLVFKALGGKRPDEASSGEVSRSKVDDR